MDSPNTLDIAPLRRAYNDLHPGQVHFDDLTPADRRELKRRFAIASKLDAAVAMQRLTNQLDASRIMEAGMTSAAAVLAVVSFVRLDETRSWQQPEILPEA